MRILVSTTTGLGHVLPLVPLAGELASRGHDVRWIGGPEDIGSLTPAGVHATPGGIAERERHGELMRRRPDLGQLPPAERRSTAFSTGFAELSVPSVIHDLRREVAAWRPDVVVHEAAEMAAPLVAAANGIPSVCHGFGEIVPEAAVRAAGDVLAPAWADAGLTPDQYAGSYRGIYVDIYPPSLLGEPMDHVPRAQLARPAEAPRADGRTVYVTFGTLFGHDLDPVRDAVLGAAAAADDVLVTLGRHTTPGDLGPVPDHVRVEGFLPQAEVLPDCASVVCHGGSGTILAALAHGLPVVCIPQGADQFSNAANVDRTGAGLRLIAPTEADVTAAVARVGTAGPRSRAGEVAEEIAAMPAVSQVADAVERHAVA